MTINKMHTFALRATLAISLTAQLACSKSCSDKPPPTDPFGDSIGGDPTGDSPGDTSSGDTTLGTIELSQAQAFCNTTSPALGLQVDGAIAGGALASLRLRFYDDLGTLIPVNETSDTLELPVEHPNITTTVSDDGDFSLILSDVLSARLAMAKTIELEIRNENDKLSNTLNIECGTPPEVALDEICDPYAALNVCVTPAGCSQLEFKCQVGTAPAIEEAYAFYQPTKRVLGLWLSGKDAENDMWAMRAELLDGQGKPLSIDGERLPVLKDVLKVTQGAGDFYGSTGGPLPRNIPLNAPFVGVRLWAIDALGLQSASFDVALAQPPWLDYGQECRLDEALGLCPIEQVCGPDDGFVDSDYYCVAPVALCADAWPVTNLNDYSVTDGFSYAGVGAGNRYVLGASCGGGGTQSLHTFTAPQSGVFEFSVEPNAGQNPVLFVRSHCTLNQAKFELACLDNDDVGAGEWGATVTVQLTTDERVYVIVGSSRSFGADAFSGDYTLNISQVTP